MTPAQRTIAYLLSIRTPSMIFLERVADQLEANGGKAMNTQDSLSWIASQASDGMHTAAGAATTHGDDSGALEMLHRILSDIAINAEMALDAIQTPPSEHQRERSK